MRYKEFSKFSKISVTALKSKPFTLFLPKIFIKKFNRKIFFNFLKTYNLLVYYNLYKLKGVKKFYRYWKYFKFNSKYKQIYYLKSYKNYVTFFFSHKVRNLFCIVYQTKNIETFFSSCIAPTRNLRVNFFLQFKIIRYILYVYSALIKHKLILNFSAFSIKIKHIIKIFFHWAAFYIRSYKLKKKILFQYIVINNKFLDKTIKKRRYPTKKRYLQRRSKYRSVQF